MSVLKIFLSLLNLEYEKIKSTNMRTYKHMEKELHASSIDLLNLQGANPTFVVI